MFKQDSNHLDQHFLIDNEVINNFIEYASIKNTDVVVEIGPGNGTLTKKIALLAKEVICIEKDTNLKEYLDKIEEEYNNVKIIYDNVLKTYIPSCNKIITALPYSIIEPFINKMLKCNFDELIMIMGSSYVDSVYNHEITKLSLLTNSFFKVEKGAYILPNSFYPKPRVKSCMIKLTPISKETFKNDITSFLFREMFFRRLLKIKKSLMEALIDFYKINNLTCTKKEAKDKINKLNIKDDIKEITMENLSNDKLKELYLLISNNKDVLWKD